MMDFFKKRLDFFREQEVRLEKNYNILGNVRLMVFTLGSVLAIYFYYSGYKNIAPAVLTIFFIAFVALVIKHRRVSNELIYTKKMALLSQKSIDRMNNNWTNFEDTGSEFIDKNHPYSSDLDIFGDKSLFQWLNCAGTLTGRKKLAHTLSNPMKEPSVIKKRQNAIKELKDNLDFCLSLQCETLMNKDIAADPEKILEYAEDNTRVMAGNKFYFIFIILPVCLVMSIILKLTGLNFSWNIPMLILCVNCLLYAFKVKKVSFLLNDLGSFKNRINVYKCIIGIIENEKFEDDLLNNIKGMLCNNSERASDALKKLNRIADFVDVRYSQFYLIFNLIFFWDIHCMRALEKWKNQYGKSIRSWFECAGMFEELISFAEAARINPDWSFPEFSAGEKLVIDAKKMGHPLISSDKRVCNDLSVNNNICIITGSNMSGKTTLLRTVGINLVLAYAGSVVCASYFNCSIMEIATSMRISDNLSEGISTFKAELMRIKMIIDIAGKQQKMIFLIDEIFKGTNSADRLTGAKSVLKNLDRSWVIGFVSTHDLELCDLGYQEGINIKNYHFTETYEDDKIKFDYKLRPGRSETRNAIYLMKMVGIDA